jgi:PhzF family phenazine biosynthesis protein
VVLKIYQVDAFAEKIFRGNPAAVIPLENWLNENLMQKIAMENNLSETAFFVKTNAGYHLRWFTPEYEIDLCGHATLASAYIIKNFIDPHIQEISFTTEKAGVLKASAADGIYTLNFPARMPLTCKVPEKLLPSLGISSAVEILKARDYFVVLPNEEAVINIEPDFSMMKELDAIGVIVTSRAHAANIVSRCFYPGAGIQEDPVTGSAHCNIVPYWSKKSGINKFVCKQLSVRGGTLDCEFKDDRVFMSGSCVLFLEGEIYV